MGREEGERVEREGQGRKREEGNGRKGKKGRGGREGHTMRIFKFSLE